LVEWEADVSFLIYNLFQISVVDQLVWRP
jgi:hypothetical protein